MSDSLFYDLEPLERIAVNLFYGWGYNFYRVENQLRADDLVLRSQVGGLLGQARAAVEAAESAWRRERLPPPSREKPRPDPAAIEGAQTLERLSQAIGALEGRIRAQPVPENDRMTQRWREEAATLRALIDCDLRLAGRVELLRAMVAGKDGAALIGQGAAIQEGLDAIEASLRERQAALFV
jgi:hypothetical protein